MTAEHRAGDTDGDAPDAPGGDTAGPDPAPPHAHAGGAAGCPVCAFFATVQGAHPDATTHLVQAGRELIGAARAFLDAAESALDEQYPAASDGPPPADPDSHRLRRIDLA